MTGAAFAARIGVKEATLRHWKWLLGQGRRRVFRRATGAGPAFVEIAPLLAGSLTASEPFEVVLGEDVRLRIPPSFDESALRRLLAVLRER